MFCYPIKLEQYAQIEKSYYSLSLLLYYSLLFTIKLNKEAVNKDPLSVCKQRTNYNNGKIKSH
jgi:hypothetical protein